MLPPTRCWPSRPISSSPTSQPGGPRSHNRKDSSTPTIDKQLAACLHTTVAFLEQNSPADVQSPDFSDANGDDVSSEVDYERTSVPVSAGFTVLNEAQFPSCLQTALNAFISYQVKHPANPSDTLPLGVSIGNSTVGSMSFPTYGDRSLAYRVTIPISASSLGLLYTGYADLVFAQKGRTVVIMSFFGVNNPLDTSMEQQLTSLTVGRLVST